MLGYVPIISPLTGIHSGKSIELIKHMLGHVPIVSPLTGVTGGGQEGRLVCDLQNTMATILFYRLFV